CSVERSPRSSSARPACASPPRCCTASTGSTFSTAGVRSRRGTSRGRAAPPLRYGIYWLDFLARWDPKSPWHDRRVRLAASLAIDRNAINEAEMLGLGKPAGAFSPPQFAFALPVEPPPHDPKRAKQLLTEAGYPNGFDAGDLTP